MFEKHQSGNDLGKDSIGKLMLNLSVPAITAQLVNMLYNIIDRMYIGHIPKVGPLALTGVGITFPIILLLGAFSLLIGMGGSPRAAIKMGEGSNQQAEEILGNCFTTLLLLSAVLISIFLALGEPLLILFGASDSTLPYALNYLNIYICGTFFSMIYMGLNPFITTQGFATTSMLTIIIGAVTNIILDPIFIFGLHMGVQGAALATIISQMVSAIWVVLFLTGKKTYLKIRLKTMLIKPSVILPVFALGLSPFIMQSTESLLNICFNTSLLKYGGDVAVGSMTILMSTMQMLVLPLNGFAQGAQPIISYNFGAKNKERVIEAFHLLIKSSIIYSVAFCLLIMLFPQIPITLFSNDPVLSSMTKWAIRIYIAGGFMLGAQVACQQSFIAVSQAKISLILALLRKIFLLIPLIYILPMFFQNQVFAVFLAEPVADITAACITLITFKITISKLLGAGFEKEKVSDI